MLHYQAGEELSVRNESGLLLLNRPYLNRWFCLETFKLVCDMNNIYVEASVQIFSHFVKRKFVSAMNCSICANDRLLPFVESMRNK